MVHSPSHLRDAVTTTTKNLSDEPSAAHSREVHNNCSSSHRRFHAVQTPCAATTALALRCSNMANIKSGGRSRNVLLTLGRDVTGLAQAGLTGSVDGAVPNSRDIFDSSDGGNDGQRRIS